MVYFVGAGSGAPDLITVRGKNLLEQADVIIYAGSLVNPELLSYKKEGCEVYNSATMTLEEVLEVMEQAHAEQKMIVRLHTGDPCIYGAIREQMDILDEKVTSKGKFYYQKSGKIRMEYAQPVNYLIVINDSRLKIVSDGKKSVMSLTANKMMNQMQDMLTACMIGDLSKMSSDYKLEYFENDSYYIVKIKPVNKAIQAYISEIEIYLDKKDMSVYKLRLSETATNYTEYEFYNKRFNALKDETKFFIR